MPYYVLKFAKHGKRPSDAPEKAMIQSESVLLAKAKADVIAEGSGGGKALLQLFNETGLVATRSPEGRWSH